MGEDIDLRTYSPLTFAFLGDAVYSLYVREEIVRRGNMPSHKLHKKTSEIVKAQAQAKVLDVLKEFLTDEEKEIVIKGTHAKPEHHAKNASLTDYHKATGLEALFGFLYLKENFGRIRELAVECIRITEDAS